MAEPHALIRFRERYGREITLPALIALQESLPMRGTYRGPDGQGRELWQIEVDDLTVLCVRSPTDGRIVTFLPWPRRPTLADVWPSP